MDVGGACYALCADEAMLRRMESAGQPWAVSHLAQAAGIAALDEDEYLRQSRQLIFAEKAHLRIAFTGLGLHVLGGEANYLFFQSHVKNLAEKLKLYGIMIRDCPNYRGLDNAYYRAAVRTKVENDALIGTLRRVLTDGEGKTCRAQD